MTCRWCKYKKPEPEAWSISCGALCPECSASEKATLSFDNGNGQTVGIWHNPDNSLYFEFNHEDGKTARYTLSEALLLKVGALELSDLPLNGERRDG